MDLDFCAACTKEQAAAWPEFIAEEHLPDKKHEHWSFEDDFRMAAKNLIGRWAAAVVKQWPEEDVL